MFLIFERCESFIRVIIQFYSAAWSVFRMRRQELSMNKNIINENRANELSPPSFDEGCA